MKKSILSLICFLFAVGTSSAQSYQWAKRIGGYGVDFGRAIGSDAQGNIYVAGQFEFDGYFDGSNATPSLTAFGTHDIFLAKYSPTGSLLWVRKAGGTGGDAGTAIYVDAAGNSYITGEMEGTSYFGNITLNCMGSNDIFVAKYDANGNVVFAAQAGGYSGDRGRAIVADASGNVYVTGEFRQSATFGAHTVTAVASTNDYKDYFLAKYNPLLGWEWVRPGGSSIDDQGQAICLDASGNIIVAGYHGPGSTFGSASLSSAGGFDMFLAKYTPSGTLDWIQRAGGQWDDYISGLAYNKNDNIIYLTGEFRGTSDFGSITKSEQGWGDIFVAAYSSAGSPIWVSTAGGSSATDFGKSIALDASNNIYITGGYGKSATFPASMNGDTSEVFIASFNTSGNLRWVIDAKGSGKEDHGKGITVDPSGNIYVVGNYNEHLGTASSTLNIGNAILTGFSNEDMFVLKYSPVLPSGIEEHSEAFSNVFPNPVSTTVSVKVNHTGELYITNEIGQTLFRKSVTKDDLVTIDVTGYSKGLYFIRMGDKSRKLVVY